MKIGLYNQDTHVCVPMEPNSTMANACIKSIPYNSEFDTTREDADYIYYAMIAAAPPHGAALPSRDELIKLIEKYVDVYGDDFGNPVVIGVQKSADAILALLGDKLK